jgi:hypothetical protein
MHEPEFFSFRYQSWDSYLLSVVTGDSPLGRAKRMIVILSEAKNLCNLTD